jgi:hypothetical protein
MLDSTPHDRWFFSALGLILVVLVAAGFAPSFYARSWFTAAPSLPALVQLHGIVGTAWVTLFALQTLLVARGRVPWHRRVGAWGGTRRVRRNRRARYRERRAHARRKRLMMLAAVVLLPPAIGRLFGQLALTSLNLPVYACFAFACVIYDATRGRPHAISLLGAMALVALDVVATTWRAAVGS